MININGSSNNYGSGAGVVMESPDGYSVEHSIRFGFRTSNNAAEYKAALAGMDLAKIVKVKGILLKLDSRHMVIQSTGEFEAIKESMKQYQEAVKKRMDDFDEVIFKQVTRRKNEKTDALAK